MTKIFECELSEGFGNRGELIKNLAERNIPWFSFNAIIDTGILMFDPEAAILVRLLGHEVQEHDLEHFVLVEIMDFEKKEYAKWDVGGEYDHD